MLLPHRAGLRLCKKLVLELEPEYLGREGLLKEKKVKNKPGNILKDANYNLLCALGVQSF